VPAFWKWLTVIVSGLLLVALDVTASAGPAGAARPSGSERGSQAGPTTPIAVSGDGGHACVLLADGTIRCWGNNIWGALGNGTAVDWALERPVPVPVPVVGISTATAVDTGSGHTCALLADRTVRCWGSNRFGQVGHPSIPGTQDPPQPHPAPVQVPGIATANAVAAGGSLTCALLADRTVSCWGGSGHSYPGGGDHRAYPVEGITDVTAITAGDIHACGLLADHRVQCWNYMNYGPIRDEMGAQLPLPVPAIDDAVAITAGLRHTCALLGDHTIRCWGRNDQGQLGNPTNADTETPVTIPVAVTGISDAIAIAAAGEHTCAQLADHTLRCWGANGAGQLGNGTLSSEYTANIAPTPVTGIIDAAAFAPTCAIGSDHTVKCWGANRYGQLGSTAVGPVAVDVGGGARAIAVGAEHACAVRTDGTVGCWGRNTDGQLGVAGVVDAPTAVTVPGVTDAVAIAAGPAQTCAVGADGSTTCWGVNPSGPVGPEHTCALRADRTVTCQGANAWGQVGDGTTTDAAAPVPVAGITTATAVAVAGYHSCALLGDHTVRCWGTPWFTGSTVPLPVRGIPEHEVVRRCGDVTVSTTGAGAVSVTCTPAGEIHVNVRPR
jgi:alpha-tubulin suppressor-like RCC1 family protein